MGKTEENDKSKLKLKSVSKPGGSFGIHSLNNFREVGSYTWIAREMTDEMGFPDCVKETDDCHYCEGQLFVMRHGAEEISQSTDTFGQVLTIINHETGATNIYTRAVHPLDSDEWTPWQMVATGDPKLITENNSINEGFKELRELVEKISERIETAETKASHYQGLSVKSSSNSVVFNNPNVNLDKEHTILFPVATSINAGIITADDKNFIDELDKAIIPCDDSFKILDQDGNVAVKLNATGFNIASTSYKLIDDSMPWLTICDEKGYVFYSSRKDVISNVRESLIKERSVAAVSWIDDDFNVYDDSSELRLPYVRLREWSNTNGIYIDFATPPLNERKTLFAQELENEGFRFLLHPIHDGWYSEGGYTHDIVKVKKSLAECVRFHKHNFVGDGRILVWPGSSNKFTDNVEFVSQICDCAITATYDGTNHCADNSKYQLQRIAINGLSTTRTKTSVKEQIKRYIDTGDWVILYTHLYQATDMDTVDETTDSWANIKEIAEYANSLCRIRPTEVVWNKRKLMYNF